MRSEHETAVADMYEDLVSLEKRLLVVGYGCIYGQEDGSCCNLHRGLIDEEGALKDRALEIDRSFAPLSLTWWNKQGYSDRFKATDTPSELADWFFKGDWRRMKELPKGTRLRVKAEAYCRKEAYRLVVIRALRALTRQGDSPDEPISAPIRSVLTYLLQEVRTTDSFETVKVLGTVAYLLCLEYSFYDSTQVREGGGYPTRHLHSLLFISTLKHWKDPLLRDDNCISRLILMPDQEND